MRKTRWPIGCILILTAYLIQPLTWHAMCRRIRLWDRLPGFTVQLVIIQSLPSGYFLGHNEDNLKKKNF